MKNKFISSIVVALLGILWSFSAWSQVDPGVQVMASQQLRQDGSAMYHYKVVNNSARAIVGLIVGSDYYHGTSELTTYPVGWSVDSAIPAASFNSPSGWQAAVITTEESPFVEIEWRNNGHSDISPGQSVAGFGVAVPQPNPLYSTAHWTVLFADSTAASGQLVVDGNPRIVGRLGAASQLTRGQWTVSVEFTNNGGGIARNVSIGQVSFRTLVGAGNVTLATPAFPQFLGDLQPGSAKTLQFVINVPVSVKKISLTESGTLHVESGGTFAFSSAQAFFSKN